jgi:hypothetical protein
MSRIYLGVHWRMDQEDGQALGRAVAQYVADNYFQPVPEPGGLALTALAMVTLSRVRRRANGSGHCPRLRSKTTGATVPPAR